MIRMRYRNSQRIGGVVLAGFQRLARGGQQHPHHLPHLVFIGRARAHDGFFNEARGIFRNRQAAGRQCHNQRPPRLPELEGGCAIGGDEGFLNRGGGGFIKCDNAREIGMQRQQALTQGKFGVGRNGSAIHKT